MKFSELRELSEDYIADIRVKLVLLPGISIFLVGIL